MVIIRNFAQRCGRYTKGTTNGHGTYGWSFTAYSTAPPTRFPLTRPLNIENHALLCPTPSALEVFKRSREMIFESLRFGEQLRKRSFLPAWCGASCAHPPNFISSNAATVAVNWFVIPFCRYDLLPARQMLEVIWP